MVLFNDFNILNAKFGCWNNPCFKMRGNIFNKHGK